MKRYALIASGLIVFFLLLFLIINALDVRILIDPTPWMASASWQVALIGVGLLVVDVLLPVPSSLVMIAHGLLFGIWWGTLLSWGGSVGATLVGFAIGRRGGKLMDRCLSRQEKERADVLLRRWGGLAIIVTRPVPVLAETTAIIAGSTAMSWRTTLISAVTGSLPPALVYAVVGAKATSLNEGLLVFFLGMLLAGLFWLASRRVLQGASNRERISNRP